MYYTWYIRLFSPTCGLEAESVLIQIGLGFVSLHDLGSVLDLFSPFVGALGDIYRRRVYVYPEKILTF